MRTLFGNWYAEWRQSDFWLRNRPKTHFDTPSSLCPDALADLLTRTVDPPRWVVEVGAGDGVLLSALGRRLPGAARHAVEARPLELPGVRGWQSFWDTGAEAWDTGLAELLAELVGPGLLLAVEWLDDLPCPVLDELTDPATLAPADRDWLTRWWPHGAAREVGRTRDRAWAWWAERLPAGSTMICLDYGHTRSTRPDAGSFTGFRDGRSVRPEPGHTADTNWTAAVAVDSLAAAVEATGARRLELARLRELARPAEPSTGLAGLALRSQYAVLADPARFGDFWLVAHHLPE